MRRAAIIALLSLAAGCSSVGADPSEGCSYGGSVHPAGTSFPATDGCNSCVCDSDGRVACTKGLCAADGGGPLCDYNGTSYPAGATFTSGCATCGCYADGTVGCTTGCAMDGGTDGGPTCTDGEKVYKPGDQFVRPDGCSMCECSTVGTLACQEGPRFRHCFLDATYTYGWIGGDVAFLDTVMLTPPTGYEYSRSPVGGTTPSAICTPAIPFCTALPQIDMCDITADLAEADVQRALSLYATPLYGVDSRPVDGQVFELKRSLGGSILVGGDCPATSSSCVPIPAGVAKLVADLRALDEQQLADPSCATFQR
jgi:hypothetical protein